ncbi:type I restriction-modification system R subunit [Streptococcus pneumoniae]|nr:type I restriction-modification system R subunit [Streptococcus pneumoniae]
MGNFSFLLKNDEYESFSKPCIEAENMIATSTVATAFMARRALEQAVHWIYSHDSYLEAPYRATLSSLVWDDDFRDIVDSELQKLLGHSKIDTTLAYAMVNQNNVKHSHQKFIS